MKKENHNFCYVERKEKGKKERRQRKTPPSYIEQRKIIPQRIQKHTEIITINITINDLPTPNRYLFFGRKKTMKKNFLKTYFLIDLPFFSYPIHIAV